MVEQYIVLNKSVYSAITIIKHKNGFHLILVGMYISLRVPYTLDQLS